MAINLMSLQPHKVSRDLSGYITYIYGPPKVGKTTLASQMPKSLLLAFEKGYNAIPGIMAQDITSWSDMKAVVRELKKQEVKDTFSTVCVDTVDVAAVLCEKYVCSQAGVNAIGEVPYGQGWSLLKKEFEEVFRTITQLGYAVYFISHVKEVTCKRLDGTEYTAYRPSVTTTYNSIIENLADLYGYMHPVIRNNKTEIVITLRSNDGTISCGGRFKYIAPEISSDYNSLVKALNDAIDTEAKLTEYKYVTDEREQSPIREELDYDKLMAEFTSMVQVLIDKDKAYYSPRITTITNKYLGKNKKVSESTPDQVEIIKLIVDEVREDLYNKTTENK